MAFTVAGGLIAATVGVFVLTSPFGDSTDLVKQVTYDDDEAGTVSPHTSTPDGISTTDEVALRGDQAGVALLRPDDPQWKEDQGYRAEWHGVDWVPLDTERWHGINIYMPDDWHQGLNERTSQRRIVFQYHTSGGPGWSPIYGILVRGDESNPSWALYRKDQYINSRDSIAYRNEVLWEEPATEEEWVSFTVHVMWTTDDTGYIELYRDRTLVYSERGIRTMNNEDATQGPYSKWGIYGQPTRMIFDEIRVAEGPDQLDAVSPAEFVDG